MRSGCSLWRGSLPCCWAFGSTGRWLTRRSLPASSKRRKLSGCTTASSGRRSVHVLRTSGHLFAASTSFTLQQIAVPVGHLALGYKSTQGRGKVSAYWEPCLHTSISLLDRQSYREGALSNFHYKKFGPRSVHVLRTTGHLGVWQPQRVSHCSR